MTQGVYRRLSTDLSSCRIGIKLPSADRKLRVALVGVKTDDVHAVIQNSGEDASRDIFEAERAFIKKLKRKAKVDLVVYGEASHLNLSPIIPMFDQAAKELGLHIGFSVFPEERDVVPQRYIVCHPDREMDTFLVENGVTMPTSPMDINGVSTRVVICRQHGPYGNNHYNGLVDLVLNPGIGGILHPSSNIDEFSMFCSAINGKSLACTDSDTGEVFFTSSYEGLRRPVMYSGVYPFQHKGAKKENAVVLADIG